jgi:hypothetical protein
MSRAAIALTASAVVAAFGGSSRATLATPVCHAPVASAAYSQRVRAVLGSRHDVLGERLLRAPGGPTFAAAHRLLPPLLFAAGPGGRPLTASGVYYLPFTLPYSVGGSRGFGLHVADGSQIIVRRVGGPSLTVFVGRHGDERYGSCLARLQTPRLAEGYLPILQVAYSDRAGVRYRQESFVGRLPGSRSLVSFVRVDADARAADSATRIELVTSHAQKTVTLVPRGRTAEIGAAFVHVGAHLERLDADTYAAARASVVAFWQQTQAGTPTFVVPEPDVLRAERALLVQELELTWRYSVGNTYEELSYAEALDVARVLAEYGYGDVSRQILRYTLRRLPSRFTNWRAGERLVAGAQYFRLLGDVRYVGEETPGLGAIVERLAGCLGANGLLPRERYSSDIADEIYSLQGQTLVWQGLMEMSRVWAATGHAGLARRAGSIAVRLERGLRRAVASSQRRLPDGSLFVPAALLDRSAPFDRLTDSRNGTYWNLVAPYALASGFFAPHGGQALGLLRYLLGHGSRLIGIVRAGAYRLAADGESVSGTDQVYGSNVSRFLADNDQPDQLDLSLYGTLAAALTPGTYVSGEAASVSPMRGAWYRTMYLPPNNDTSATFLETLRLLLVHEVRGPEGLPRGLELAFATPRGWLAAGKSIVVRGAPTSFGPISYSLTRTEGAVRVVVDPPATPQLRSLKLRVRLPGLTRTLDLSGRRGRIELVLADAKPLQHHAH